jgi:hypothetical protein
MINAQVKHISNGFIVTQTSPPPAQGGIDTVYAGTVPEVVYWLGRIFDPVNGAPAAASASAPTPQIIDPSTDPTVGQFASVSTVASGGFVVTQVAFPGSGAQQVELYCANMDAVSAALTEIFTPPVVE